MLGEAPAKAGSPGGRGGSPVCARPRRVRSREQTLHWSGPKRTQGLPWWSRGSDSVLPMKGAQVQSLVRKLRFHMPRSTAKKKATKNRQNKKPDESSLRSRGQELKDEAVGYGRPFSHWGEESLPDGSVL